MGRRNFFEASAKERARAAVEKVESQTSAEIVISAHGPTTTSQAAPLALAATLALGSLATMIYAPSEFHTDLIPVEVAATFALAYFLVRTTPRLRRWITPPSVRRTAVERAAKSAFVDLGIGRTTRRTGILVYAAIDDGMVALVADVGIDRAALGSVLGDAETAASTAVRAGNFDAFIGAIEALGPGLGAALPHREGDANELSDEVR